MALLRNNNVYIFSIQPFKAWYHSYNQYIISPMTDMQLDTTFESDMKVLINQMNGIMHQNRYEEYIQETSQLNNAIADERQFMLDKLWDMINDTCLKVFPEFPGAPSMDIFFHFDKDSIFVLDRRRMTYVPNSLCHTVSAAGGEPLFNDDAWI